MNIAKAKWTTSANFSNVYTSFSPSVLVFMYATRTEFICRMQK